MKKSILSTSIILISHFAFFQSRQSTKLPQLNTNNTKLVVDNMTLEEKAALVISTGMLLNGSYTKPIRIRLHELFL